MSYDVDLMGEPEPVECFHCGVTSTRPKKVWGDWNYTYNCYEMWDAAGFRMREFDGKRAGDCASILGDALAVLAADRQRFETFNPPNGWGSYESSLERLGQLLRAMREYPDATVRVS